MPDSHVPPPSAENDKPTGDTGRGRSILGLHRGDQIFVGVMLAILAVLSFGYWIKLSGWGRDPVEIERLPARESEFRLDVNRASWVQWAQLEGIGEVLARRIVADRIQRGPFANVDDVRRVNGVGAKKLEAIRQWLYVDSTTAGEPPPIAP